MQFRATTSMPLKVSAYCKSSNKLLISKHEYIKYCYSFIANILTSLHEKLNGSLIVNPIYEHGHNGKE